MTPLQGIIISCFSGLLVTFLILFYKYWRKKIDSYHVYKYLKKNTTDEPGGKFKLIREIADASNLTEDRVHKICYEDKRIDININKKGEYGIYGNTEESAYGNVDSEILTF